MASYTSQYPTLDDDHVKATTTLASYNPHMACNSALSLTGAWTGVQWVSNSVVTNQRFHIDLESGLIIRRIYYENSHNSEGETDTGVQNFTFWGSNNADAFAELTYATDANWTQLTTSASAFDEHVALDQADPKYITISNSTEYQYYAFKFADDWGDLSYMGVRRIELQTEDGYEPPTGGATSFADYLEV